MPNKGDAPSRPAQTQTGRERDTGNHQQRTRRAHHTRRVVNSIVTVQATSRQASSLSGTAFATLCAAILDGAATLAVNTFGDARRLALSLHDEPHDDARLALGVANALNEITTQAHRAAEIAATAAAGEEGAL